MGSELLINVFSSLEARYAVIDEEENVAHILIESENKDCFSVALQRNGWRTTKEFDKHVYLYGMDHFMSFRKENMHIIICCQLACKSTLGGEWVPLDRKINTSILQRADGPKYGAVCLQPEDMFCYLLAKCVYTNNDFSSKDVSRILELNKIINRKELMPKLEGVFFRFSDKMLEMINNNNFDSIIDDLWEFSDY